MKICTLRALALVSIFSFSCVVVPRAGIAQTKTISRGDTMYRFPTIISDPEPSGTKEQSFDIVKTIPDNDLCIIRSHKSNRETRYAFMRPSDHTLITPFLFNSADFITRAGVFLVDINGYKGLMDLKGKVRAVCTYDLLTPVWQGTGVHFFGKAYGNGEFKRENHLSG
jgi:hypothetical protein